MIRRTSRRAEISELRDRAVTDAQRLAALGDQIRGLIVERDVARLELARRTAELDQTQAHVESLTRQVAVFSLVAVRLGVTDIIPIGDGDSIIKTTDPSQGNRRS